MSNRWKIFWMRAVVADGERALLSRNGRFMRVLGPGKHVLFDPGRALSVEICKIVRAEFPVERARLIEAVAPDAAREHFEFVVTGEGEVAIVSFDGEPKVLAPRATTRVFWKGVTKIEVERVDTRADLRIAPATLARIETRANPYVLDVTVRANETGLLHVDGALAETLAPGRHVFWQVERKLDVRMFDMRPQPVEITAQEILTRDRIGLRVTLTAFTRITDAVKAAQGSTDPQQAIYRLVQFAVREAVATRTLDEILSSRDRIDVEIRAFVAARSGDLGVETTELGVKDVILPGDVRELLNKVVEAEKVAKANLIRRQEETAATRSLLNTARLMQDNPLLLRLKELESLERLTEKVGRIDLTAGPGASGLDALLQNLWRMSRPAETA